MSVYSKADYSKQAQNEGPFANTWTSLDEAMLKAAIIHLDGAATAFLEV